MEIYVGTEPVPLKKGSPVPGKFPFKTKYYDAGQLPMQHDEVLDLRDVLGFSWGSNSQDQRNQYVAVHCELYRVDAAGNVMYDPVTGEVINDKPWALGPYVLGDGNENAWYYTYLLSHPRRGQFIDSPVQGLFYHGPTQMGITGPDAFGEDGGFLFFPGEIISFAVGEVPIGSAAAAKKVSPLDLFPGADLDDPRVIGVARTLQSLDADSGAEQQDGKIILLPEVVACFSDVVATELGAQGLTYVDFGDAALIDVILTSAVATCNGLGGAELAVVSPEAAEGNLEAGLNASGIFRKNVSKTEDWGETKQKLDVMPVYFPGTRSDNTPSYCGDTNGDGIVGEGDQLGVPYEEWRLNGDPAAEECDPRDVEGCTLTMIECREVAKPILVTYMQKVDIFDDNVTTDFYDNRFSHDIFTAISRDDGTTWKRMNVSRMADLSSFDLETGEPFPGTARTPMQKIDDNKILVVWTSTYCKSGNPRYAIDVCEDLDGDGTPDPCTICRETAQGTICEPDYPYDDPYHVTDIWGVRGHQGSVDYDEVDDVADLGIGEIPYSCLWANRGVIVTQADLDSGKFDSVAIDDPNTPEFEGLQVGEILWFKPERLTSGRRDAYIPVVGSARGAGFAIAWQEDPEGLRPGKGKGPGQGWSGAISNHKTDIWYSFIRAEDFDVVDANFIPGGTPDEDRPGVGRPKALVPFSLPVRISDNDMVNTDTLKVELDGAGLPVVVNGTFVPLDPLSVEHGNAIGTKRYAYLAKTIDDDGDGVPDYQYYMDNGGTLDLCDTTATNEIITTLPGTSAHERWYRFINTEGSEKTVCVTSDGRLLDGDVSPSRPNISLQGYTKSDGTKSAWVLLAYEETKGMGHPHADDSGGTQVDKPIKQDYGKDVVYHSFDFTQPDLVAPGHIVNLPALCGGLYPTYCENIGYDTWDPAYDSICTCTPGQPIPLFFEAQNADGDWVPTTAFKQYRTEVARRTRFIVQSPSKMGDSNTLGLIIYKQGQEGQGRPADVFVRRFVKSGSGNPYRFENMECSHYLDNSEAALTLAACPSDGVVGYNCNVWGEAYGDRLCGGVFADPVGGYMRRDHINLTSADIDLKVDAGPDDDTPDDPTDDIYGTDKVLLWSQHVHNLGDESYGYYDGTTGLAGMFSNARSHRGFVRGDLIVTAYAFSPNWAAGRNGRDRYNFYIRKSFDGGQTWTTTPASYGDVAGQGIHFCREHRTDPDTHEPPVYEGFDPNCVAWCAADDTACEVTGTYIGPGEFEPARNISEISNNKETSADPRLGATPPVPPLDGRDPALPVLRFVEDYYVNNVFFVAWGTGDNLKSTGGMTVTPEAPPLDVYYTRSEDYGDTFLKLPWVIGGVNSNQGYGETVWRYDFLAHGEEEQGECQLRATPDGSKMYSIYHQMVPVEGDPNEPITRWYPWEPEESHDNDIWFRRVIFWPTLVTP